MRGESLKGSARFSGGSMKGRGVNQRSSEAPARAEPQKQAEPPKQEATKQQAPPPASPPKLGLEVNEEKGKIKGLVQPREVEGKKLVDLGPLGSMVAPAPGGTDSYLMGLDKMLVLKSKEDGTVEVYTRTLGLEGGKKGEFRGDLLPADGEVEFAGHQLEVGHLKPGQERSEKLEIKGKKYKVKLRMNEDGSVTVSGERKKSFLSQVAGFVGKIAPILAAIPGLGLAAVAAKVVTGFNAVKDFVNSAKSGNLLGMVSSAAGAFAGFSQGAAQAIASKVANFANVGQQVFDTLKHGLGKGLLQVVSNGANLVSGIARAGGDLGQGDFQKGAYGFAGTAGQVGGFAYVADSAGKGNLLPALSQGPQQVASRAGEAQKDSGSEVKYSVQGGTRLTPFDSSKLPADPTLQSGKFGGFTHSPGLDSFGGSRGTDGLKGGEGKDVLLAQNTPQHENIRKAGSQNFKGDELKQALVIAEKFASRAPINAPIALQEMDGAVTREELSRGISVLEAKLNQSELIGLKASDGTWLLAKGPLASDQEVRNHYHGVLNNLRFLARAFSAISVQGSETPIIGVGGTNETVDLKDIDAMQQAKLVQGTPAGPRLGDEHSRDVKAANQARAEAIRASGGISQPGQMPFNGRLYANPRDDVANDGNPYTMYKQIDAPPGQTPYELWWTPVPTELIPNGGYREIDPTKKP